MAAGDKNGTGNGATFVLTGGVGGTPFLATVRELSGMGASIPSVDNNILATAGVRETIPGDLAEPSDVSVGYAMRSTDIKDLEAELGIVRTATLTYAPQDALATGQQTVGTGFITEYSVDTLANDTRVEGSFTWQWDGVTGPATTDETA